MEILAWVSFVLIFIGIILFAVKRRARSKAELKKFYQMVSKTPVVFTFIKAALCQTQKVGRERFRGRRFETR